MLEKNFYLYILQCENNSYYTGYSVDVTRRYKQHLAGKCKYTRSFKPLRIAMSWRILGDKAIAMKAERFVKKLSHSEKKYFITKPKELASYLPVIVNVQGVDD
jgi:putative endonuclease